MRIALKESIYLHKKRQTNNKSQIVILKLLFDDYFPIQYQKQSIDFDLERAFPTHT